MPENRQGFRAIQKISRVAANKGRKLEARRREKQARGPRPAPPHHDDAPHAASPFGNMEVTLTPAENIPRGLEGPLFVV